MNEPGLEQSTNNSNASCLVCNKDMRKNHLQRHMKIHQKSSNSSNVNCLVCNKEMRKDNLQRHMKTIHQKPCRTCDKIYRSTQERNIHQKKCKPCRFCKKVYTSIKERNMHEIGCRQNIRNGLLNGLLIKKHHLENFKIRVFLMKIILN